MNKKCAIIAGGPSFWCDRPLDDYFVIACDKGYEHAANAGIESDLVVGDFDSYAGKIKEGVEVVRTRPEKDDTDTMLAIKLAFERGMRDILLLGATGGRMDHLLANLSACAYVAQQGGSCEMLDREHAVYVLRDGTLTLRRQENTYVSVFAVSDRAQGVTLMGFKYPLDGVCVKNAYPMGVSNEFAEDTAQITVASGTLLILVTKKDQ